MTEDEKWIRSWGGKLVERGEDGIPEWMLDPHHFPLPDDAFDPHEPYVFTPAPRQELAEVEGAWFGVQGSAVPCPLRIRVVRRQSGRFGVNALLLGEDGRSEITSEILRAIRIPEIVAALFDHFDPWGSPAPQMKPLAEYFDPDELAEDQHQVSAYAQVRSFFDNVDAGPSRSREVEELAEFARVYLQELARSPHRAMTATAKRLNISRSTANRRADRARDEGLLPRKDES